MNLFLQAAVTDLRWIYHHPVESIACLWIGILLAVVYKRMTTIRRPHA